MRSGIKRIQLDASDQTSIELSELHPDSYFQKDPVMEKDIFGQSVYMHDESALNIVSYELNKYAMAERWMKQKLTVTAKCTGYSKNIYWNDPVTIIAERHYKIESGDRNTFRIKMQRKGGEHDMIYIMQGT